ncbi:MAG: MgtC/SapB family protein [Candidatus Omnitrophica bacterium]|nr:MgtC/SapB family protein [Candidatus Omnitrophota bacterium]
MLNEWVVLLRLIMAAVLSGIVGFEREFHGRAAGFRTHILLCIGSTLVMLTSIHIFDVYNTRVPCDPARIAAGVVTGIGFLGAGTIMHSKSSVRGLTTATSLWVVAGIGLAVGSGMYFASIATTIITMITLLFFSRMEHAMIRKDWYKTLIIEAREGVNQIKGAREVLAEYGVRVTDFEVRRSENGTNMVLEIGVKLSTSKNDDHIIQEILRLEGVESVKWESD